MANCETCKKVQNAPESVPYFVHEASMARMERQIKRLWITVLVLFVCWLQQTAHGFGTEINGRLMATARLRKRTKKKRNAKDVRIIRR